MALDANSMMTRIKANIAAVTEATGINDTNRQTAVLQAFCQGVIDEIVAHSELVPITKDSGTAGAGIITGSVK
jgi:hypothetical protein